MTDQESPKVTTERTAQEEQPEKRPAPKRPKMTLDEQSLFLSSLLSRCQMASGDQKGLYAGDALLALTLDDMLRLETIQQTIAIFEMNKADDLVRREIWRKRQGGRG